PLRPQPIRAPVEPRIRVGMAEPGHEPKADIRSSHPWNAPAVALDTFDALITQLASVHRAELGRASEEAKRLSKEIEELSKENRALKNSSAAGSGGCGSSAMETGKVPADNNKNNSPMEQQAGEQDAISKERGEQDTIVDEIKLKIDTDMHLERQEKGHNGQTGKVPADNNPMEQQAGGQDAVSKEVVEQDKEVDEMELRIDINMQRERQEKGHDGQIKVDELEDQLSVSDFPAPEGHPVLAPRSDLSSGFLGVTPGGPSSHVAESPFFALPGINNFISPGAKPRYKFSRASSLSMMEEVNERRRSFEVQTSGLFSFVQQLDPSAPNGRERRKSVCVGVSRTLPALSPRNTPGTPPGRRDSRASSSAYPARASSRQSVASEGSATFDRELTGLHPIWKTQANTFGTQRVPMGGLGQHFRSKTGRGTRIIDTVSSEEQDQQLYEGLWGRQAWEVVGLLMISLDFFAVPMQVFEPYPIELIMSTTILTTLYWTCDVPFSFLVSLHSDGARHISLKAMARQYASSWLLF
ncbi:unnamed protein product, partial [Polarella glacialis]